MAKAVIPDALSRRHWLSDDLGAERALEVAEAYLAEGRAFEAVDFLRKAEAHDKLLEIGREAMESGDLFLFRAICEASGEEADASDWRTLADAAEAAGKTLYAAEARRQLQAVGG